MPKSIASKQSLNVSFEFFPPKTEKAADQLWHSINRLAPLEPSFVSVTYGAGGSTREHTHNTVARVVKEIGVPTAAHLTCVDATKNEVNDVLKDYWSAGIRHIVALRGDPSGGVGERYVAPEGGYANAAELAAGAKSIGDFEISVGCYPEKHPESADFDLDIDLLKQKIDNGATRAITQFFYDNTVYFRYLDKVRAAGINIPIVPGIMPVTNFKALSKMAGLCGTKIPEILAQQMEGLDDDPVTRKLVSTTLAAEQCDALVGEGVNHFHFYTLNRHEQCYALCHMLGIRPSEAVAA